MPERDKEFTENPLTYASATGIVLKVLADFSTYHPNLYENQEIQQIQSTAEPETSYVEDYSFNFLPYEINLSHFQVQEFEETNHLTVSVANGLLDDIDHKVKLFGQSLPDPRNNGQWLELQQKLKSHKGNLQKHLLRSMLDHLEDIDPGNPTKISQIRELVEQNRFSLI